MKRELHLDKSKARSIIWKGKFKTQSGIDWENWIVSVTVIWLQVAESDLLLKQK